MALYQGPLLPGQDQAAFYEQGIERSGGTSPYGSSTYNNPQISSQPAPQPQPTSQPSGGGSSGPDLSNPAKMTDYARQMGYDSWEQYRNAVQEQAPAQQNIDYNAIFAPAFDAINQQEQAMRGGYAADEASVEQGTAERKQGLMTEQENRLQDFGNQRTEATQQTESVVEAARRQAAEILQGIQARYGGTTGTGRFQSEILGSQATKNIATQQAALQNTMGKIGQAENNLKTEVTNLINQEDQRLETAKMQLRSQLQQSLADIGKEKGRLESEKAQMRINNLNQYQQLLAQVNARNAQFKQQLFMQAQEAQTQLDQLRQRAQTSYKVPTTFDPASLQKFNVGDTPYAAAPTSSGGYQFLQGKLGENQLGENQNEETSLDVLKWE